MFKIRGLIDSFARIMLSVAVGLFIVAQSGLPILAQAASTTCDQTNFSKFILGPDGASTYAITTTATTWQAASTLAKSQGARLAVIAGPAVNSAIFTNLSGSFGTTTTSSYPAKKAWIDLTDANNIPDWSMPGQPPVIVPSRFSWPDGTSTYSNWATGQPDGYCTAAEMAANPSQICYGENYAVINSDGRWSDEGDHGSTPLTLPAVVEWPNTTLDCVKPATSVSTPVVSPLPGAAQGDLYCTEPAKDTLQKCLQTTDGQKLCPLQDTLCNVNQELPTCPAGFDGTPGTVNTVRTPSPMCQTDAHITCPSSGAFVANPDLCYKAAYKGCPTGYSFVAPNNRCEERPQCVTGTYDDETNKCTVPTTATIAYTSPVQGTAQITKYEARGHIASTITDYAKTSTGILDVVQFVFGISNGQVSLTSYCAWGGNGNAGCYWPHWNGGTWRRVDVVQMRSANQLTVTAHLMDTGVYVCPDGSLPGDDGNGGPSCGVGDPIIGDYDEGPVAAAVSDTSEFLSCPAGYSPATPLTSATCNQILTLWGNATGVTDCSNSAEYSCSKPANACPAGTVMNSQGTCDFANPTCPGGSFQDTGNFGDVCFAPYSPVCNDPAFVVPVPGQPDLCQSAANHDCPTGFTWNGSPVDKCEAVPICVIGTFEPQSNSCYMNQTCPLDQSSCNGNSAPAVCPAGTSLNTVDNMCEADPTVTCGAGYTWSAAIDQCTLAITCPDGGTYNVTTNLCEKLFQNTCPTGYTLDSTNNVCAMSASCPGGGLYNPVTDRCESAFISTCSTGYTYDSAKSICYAPGMCQNGGTFNLAIGVCTLPYVPSCLAGFAYDTSTNRCEAAVHCPTGSTYDSASNQCVASNSYAATSNYTCPSGGMLSGTNCITGGTYAATANYTCPTGGTLSGTTCITTGSYGATANYTCPSGGTLSGTTCNTSGSYAATVNYTCPSGGTLTGTNCVTSASYAATPIYSCPSGGTLSGSTCNITSGYAATPTYACPSGGTLSGTTCSAYYTAAYDPPNCDCYSGCDVYASSFECAISADCVTYSTAPSCAGISTFTCPSGGTLINDSNGVECVINYTASVASYSCPSGGTLSGSTCNTSSSYAATLASYSCPSGGTLSGSTCNTSGSYAATLASYSCPSGGTLLGSTCNTSGSYAATLASYSCPSGGTLSGTTCDTSGSYTATLASYSCPSGGTLSGSTCNTGGSYAATLASYSCSAGDTLSGSTCTHTILTSPTCPNGAFDSSAHLCWASYSQFCSPGTTYDSGSNQCLQAASCQIGSTLNASTGRCEQAVASTCSTSYFYDPAHSICYSGPVCASGAYSHGRCEASVTQDCGTYSLDSSGKICSQSVTCNTTGNYAATGNYTCPSGGDLSGTDCFTIGSYVASSNYKCPNGGTLSGNTITCIGSYFACPIGGTLNGDTCSFNYDDNRSYYICPNGGTLSGIAFNDKICITMSSYVATLASYSCPSGGTLSGSTCNNAPPFALSSSIAFSKPLNECVSTALHECVAGTAYRGLPVTKCQTYPTCSNGMTYNAQTGSCCPGAALSCHQIVGDTTEVSPGITAQYCSPNKCQNDTTGMDTINDTPTGQNDKTNNGAKDPSGNCLGQIYLFNGTDMRCRIYDDTGMATSIAELVAEIALMATGVGAAMLGTEFAMATMDTIAAAGEALGMSTEAAINAAITVMQAAISSTLTIATNTTISEAVNGNAGTGLTQGAMTFGMSVGGSLLSGMASGALSGIKDYVGLSNGGGQNLIGQVTSITDSAGDVTTLTQTASTGALSASELTTNLNSTGAMDGYVSSGTITTPDGSSYTTYIKPDDLNPLGNTGSTAMLAVDGQTGLATWDAYSAKIATSPTATYFSQLQSISSQWAPAISQGMMGNYTPAHCCYPDTLSGSCESSEFQEAPEQHNGLCHIVGSYCSKKFLFTCMVEKQTSCCFQSQLSRIMHEQGRPQLHSFSNGWGSAESPICRGFTPEEFQSLNFSIMDLSEWEASLNSNMSQIAPFVSQLVNSIGSNTTQSVQSSPGYKAAQ